MSHSHTIPATITLDDGQHQRVAIARNSLKGPKIQILDKATSAINVHGARIVQAFLNSVSKGQKTVLIVHRLSTIMKVDKIVVLRKIVIVRIKPVQNN